MRKAWIVWVAVFLAGGGGLWMIKTHFSNREQSAGYEVAPACAEGRPSPDCRSRESATIAGKKEKRSGRSRTYYLEFRVADGNALAMVSSDQYDVASTGEPIDVERWNGYVTRIYRNGKPEDLLQTPKPERTALVMGIVGVFIALCMVWVGISIRRGQRLAKASQLA